MIRRLFMLLSGLSLVLCVAACALWVRSYRSEYRAGKIFRGSRYTLASCGGRAMLFGPPPVPRFPSPAVEVDARLAATALRNDDIEWAAVMALHERDGTLHPVSILEPSYVQPCSGTAASRLDAASNSGAATRILLMTLERPEAFAAAHVLLTRQFDHTNVVLFDTRQSESIRTYPSWLWEERRPFPWTKVVREGVSTLRSWTVSAAGRGPVFGTFRGLSAEFNLPPSPEDDRPAKNDPLIYYYHIAPFPGAPRIDPGQQSAIRDQWHRRLDAPVVSVAYRNVAGVLVILPAICCGTWLLRRWRSYLRVQHNHCPTCGYDLRSTPDRCPECGAAATHR
jgi:hypothetical protein